MNQKGFFTIILIFIGILITFGLVVGGVFYIKNNSKSVLVSFNSAGESPSSANSSTLNCNYGLKSTVVKRGDQEHQSTTFEEQTASDGRKMRAGSLIVKFREDVSSSLQEDVHKAAKAVPCERIGSADNLWRVQTSIELTEAAIKIYRSDTNVEYVEPDYIILAVDSGM